MQHCFAVDRQYLCRYVWPLAIILFFVEKQKKMVKGRESAKVKEMCRASNCEFSVREQGCSNIETPDKYNKYWRLNRHK